ncbi:IPT/TIG domain-containing protein [Paenibacillus lautus]|uniref:IPT/TIG domain-containing protein n=1 Tax=Paenibacillus lautus TaxID=1401 RepID=UPI001C1037DF|nr:IPT/TIG domain-containing protein [Paenibacillus lautus]MBU5349293.1 IPT/TIG domain-containing protein [Paenibacillus lautus]
MKIRRWLLSLLAVMVILAGLQWLPGTIEAADNYLTVNKTVTPNNILEGEEVDVRLDITGAPPVNVVLPNDVILIIDRSGSMGTQKMEDAKNAAKGFIDLMDFSKHRVGIVDYSDASRSFDLTTDTSSVKNYISTIKASGGTATGDSISKAMEMLEGHRDNAQPVIVLLTDGDATIPNNNPYQFALDKANEAKEAGIVFYTIALLESNANPDTSGPNKLLKEMATTAHHHHYVLGSVGLSEIYAAIVQEIGLASAYDVIVNDIISDQFEIIPGSYDNNIPKPTVEGNKLTWNFLELKKDTLSFTYKIKHKKGSKVGLLPVNGNEARITYKDYTGVSKQANIPNPTVTVKYPAPVITAVNPAEGKVTGGDTVTITGENFRVNPQVTFAGKYSTQVDYISPNEVRVLVPPGNQGEAVVKLINDDYQAATANYTYYDDPVITNILPNNGPLEGNTPVQVRGSSFMKGVKVKFGEVYSTSVTFNHSGYLSVMTPAAANPGVVDVVIENPDGRTATLSQSYTYNEPPKMTVTSITPNKGLTTGGETVTINGTLIQTGSKVFFGDVEGTNYKYSSVNKMLVNAPANNIPGTVDVRVEGPDGYSVDLPAAYTYENPPLPPAPTILKVTPASGVMTGGNTIYVDGTGFQPNAKVYFDGSEVSKVVFSSSSRLSVTAPVWPTPGKVAITVTNPDLQSVTLADAYEYLTPPPPPGPAISTVLPAKGPFLGGNRVYVDGQNFANGAQVYFNDQAIATTFVTTSRLSIVAPEATNQGYVTVKVVNPDSQYAEKANGYLYEAPIVIPAPIITSVTPNTGTKSGNYLMTINGDNFQKGAVVTIGSTQLNLYAYVNTTQVRVMVPSTSTAGTVDVTITNPDGQSATLTGGFTYEEPKISISKLIPGNGPLAGGTSVYVDGANYDPGMTVTFNGQPISFTYVSNARIRIITPAGTSQGSVPIELTNPSGSTATAQFTYDAPPVIPAPSISKLSVASGSIAGGYTMYVDGAYYQNGATIDFGGTIITPQFVNSSRLMIRVPSAVTPGIVSVTVNNPDGKISNSKDFEYK